MIYPETSKGGDYTSLELGAMKVLCIMLGHRWCYWTGIRDDQHRQCIHRQCWHCHKVEVDLRQPGEETTWWAKFGPKQGKLTRS